MDKRHEDLQNPLTHEGADPDDHDSNENADEKVDILQPDGSEAPRADAKVLMWAYLAIPFQFATANRSLSSGDRFIQSRI